MKHTDHTTEISSANTNSAQNTARSTLGPQASQPQHTSVVPQPQRPDTGSFTPGQLLQLQRTIGNQALIRQLQSSETQRGTQIRAGSNRNPIQRVPSDFKNKFSQNKLMETPLFDFMAKDDDVWVQFLIKVKPYFKIADNNRAAQLQSFPSIFLYAQKVSADIYTKCTNQQKELFTEIFNMLDREKAALLGGAATKGIKKNEKGPDPKLKPEDGRYSDPQALTLTPLFQGEPSIDDVRQGYLGDCYLLAAVTSVVHSNPIHFFSHMSDELDGNVTVCLYKQNGEPVNIKVAKTVVGEQFAQGVLWVKILEKAYAAAGFSGSYKDIPADQRSYGGIEGGEIAVALRHLTGKATKEKMVGVRRKGMSEEVFKQVSQSLDESKREIRVLEAKIEEMKKKQEDTKQETEQLDKLYIKVAKIQSLIGKMDGELSMQYISTESIQELIRQADGEQELVNAIETQAGLHNPILNVPGKLGSGKYGQDELDLYQQIKSAVDAKKPIGASTKNKIEDSENKAEQERGHSGNEAKVNGLVSKHAYTILDYEPKQYAANAQIRVKLRNPWGFYGRTYVDKHGKDVPRANNAWEGKGTAVPAGDGVFWMDIADMVSFFDRISYTD